MRVDIADRWVGLAKTRMKVRKDGAYVFTRSARSGGVFLLALGVPLLGYIIYQMVADSWEPILVWLAVPIALLAACGCLIGIVELRKSRTIIVDREAGVTVRDRGLIRTSTTRIPPANLMSVVDMATVHAPVVARMIASYRGAPGIPHGGVAWVLTDGTSTVLLKFDRDYAKLHAMRWDVSIGEFQYKLGIPRCREDVEIHIWSKPRRA